jgi:hypothetical protein
MIPAKIVSVGRITRSFAMLFKTRIENEILGKGKYPDQRKTTKHNSSFHFLNLVFLFYNGGIVILIQTSPIGATLL